MLNQARAGLPPYSLQKGNWLSYWHCSHTDNNGLIIRTKWTGASEFGKKRHSQSKVLTPLWFHLILQDRHSTCGSPFSLPFAVSGLSMA